MKSIAAALVAVSALAVATPALAKTPSRLHVDVKDADGSTVKIDLPILVAKAAIAFGGESKVDVDPAERKQMKEAWQALKDSNEPATIDADDAENTVKIRASGDKVEIDVTDKKTGKNTVKVRLPGDAVDALLDGDEGLNLSAALSKLSANAAGDLITVDDEGDHVRIWLD